MSASNPASVNAIWSAGRSPFSQRGEDAESGRITQARAAVVESSPVPPDAHPASNSADADNATATEVHEEVFISLPFWSEVQHFLVSTLSVERWHVAVWNNLVAKATYSIVTIW